MMNKEIDHEADTIKVMLLDDSHAFTATHNQKSEIVANEISGTGYTAGGEALAGKAVTQGATTKWDATDVEWTIATFTAYHAVIYDDTLTNDDLMASIDFGGSKSVSAGTFKIQWHANGIVTLATAA
jgi:hypothetical protein